MDKKALFESLVYADRDFIATAYEGLTNQVPETQVTKAEAKDAGANVGFARANISATETRSFKTSTFGMLAEILPKLDAYPLLRTPPIGPTGRSTLGWIIGELSVATIEKRRSNKVHSQLTAAKKEAYGGGADAAETVFTLRNREGLILTLITSDSYFTSGFGALIGLADVVINQASVPVRALVRVMDVTGSFSDWLAIPLVMVDADHAPGAGPGA